MEKIDGRLQPIDSMSGDTYAGVEIHECLSLVRCGDGRYPVRICRVDDLEPNVEPVLRVIEGVADHG